MDKENKITTDKKYSVLDAFRCFFFLVITIIGASLVLQLVFSLVAKCNGIEYDVFIESDLVSMINYALTPIVFIIYFLIYTKIVKVKVREAISDGKPVSLLPISIAIVLAIICIFLFTPFINLIDYFFEGYGYRPDNTLPFQEKMSSSFGFLMLGMLIFALLPAIAEELIFRGVIQKGLSSKYNGWVVIIVTSVMFTLMHGSLQQTFYQLLCGIMLGYLAYVGGSLIYSIIFHFLNNMLVVFFTCFDMVSYLSYKDTIYYNAFSKIFPFLLFLLGTILVGILFWVLKYLRNKDFFRFENKKVNKFKKIDSNGVALVEKMGFKGFWSNLIQIEKIFFVASLVMVTFMWLINTVNGFM